MIPLFFQKPPTSAAGPADLIIIPKASKKVDHETELGVVIGKRGKYIPKEEADHYIAGYTAFSDMSFRDHARFPDIPDFRPYTQINWVKGKKMDNSALMDPYLDSRGEIPDTYRLELGPE